MLYSESPESFHTKCHGCGLCSLVCPAWQQRKDIRVSPHGHAKALQYGGEIKAHALFNCILCGACSPICPENIDIMAMLLKLRQKIQKKPAQQKIHNNILQTFELDDINLKKADLLNKDKADQSVLQKTVFLANPELRKDKSRISRIMDILNNQYDVAIADDDGHDISMALEVGVDIPVNRLDRFLHPIRMSEKLIVSDGLLKYKLHHWLPYTVINSVGYELSKLSQVRNNISDSDFYVIESRAYHSDFKKYVSHYDKLQQERQCQLNLNLNRLAIPTGGVSNKQLRTPACFNTNTQAKWMLSGKKYARVIVEDFKDLAVLSQISARPVIHISELM